LESEESKRMMELDAPDEEVVQLSYLVRWCINLYVRDHGANEVLDEVLANLGLTESNSEQRID
ncbi:MAG: hypothetical protein ACFFD6_04645, partial [Candidatus Thorarchaeota archaeon]